MDSIDSDKALMFNELKKKEPDFKKLEANAENSGRIFTNLRKKTFEHFLSIKSLFTPEQQTKYFSYIEKRSCCNKMCSEKDKCPKPRNGKIKCSDKDQK